MLQFIHCASSSESDGTCGIVLCKRFLSAAHRFRKAVFSAAVSRQKWVLRLHRNLCQCSFGSKYKENCNDCQATASAPTDAFHSLNCSSHNSTPGRFSIRRQAAINLCGSQKRQEAYFFIVALISGTLTLNMHAVPCNPLDDEVVFFSDGTTFSTSSVAKF